MTGLVRSERTEKLAVTIVASGNTIRDPVYCSRVLQHFRGVGDFVECPEDEQAPNARTFLGRIAVGEWTSR
jgi:hypothetical protein